MGGYSALIHRMNFILASDVLDARSDWVVVIRV